MLEQLDYLVIKLHLFGRKYFDKPIQSHRLSVHEKTELSGKKTPIKSAGMKVVEKSVTSLVFISWI